MKEFEGKVCVVSGATGGMGSALCRLYAADGAKIAMLDINQEKLDELGKELEALGGEAMGLICDVTSKASVDEAVAAVEEKWGGIDVLANTAGTSIYADFLEFKEEDWNKVISINLTGVFLLTQAVAKNMVKFDTKGNICSISSQAGRVGEPGSIAYGPTKAGIIMMTETLALDLAPHKIRATAVAPGMTDTPLFRGYLKGAVVMEGVTEEEGLQNRAEMIPWKRLAVPEDVANLMYFLTSSKADYITGATVNITGGNVNG